MYVCMYIFLELTQDYLQWLLCNVQCRQPQAVGLFQLLFFLAIKI